MTQNQKIFFAELAELMENHGVTEIAGIDGGEIQICFESGEFNILLLNDPSDLKELIK